MTPPAWPVVSWRPKGSQTRAAVLVEGAADRQIAGWVDADALQVRVGQEPSERAQDPDLFVWADDLLDEGHLEEARHEHRHVHVRRDLPLEVGEVAALGGDGAAAHAFQPPRCRQNGLQAGRLVLGEDQRLDVNPFTDLVLDRKGVGAGVAYVSGKPGVDVVENDDAEAHAVTRVISSRGDVVDSRVV